MNYQYQTWTSGLTFFSMSSISSHLLFLFFFPLIFIVSLSACFSHRAEQMGWVVTGWVTAARSPSSATNPLEVPLQPEKRKVTANIY